MDQQQPEAPAFRAPTEQPATTAPTNNKRRQLLALWLLIGPTALIVGSLILYAIVNLIFGMTTGDISIIRTIMNIILFVVGAISVMTWLPGIIAGIILLTTQKKS